AALRPDLDDLSRLLHRIPDGARVLHRVGERLLRVGVPPGPDGLDAMQRELEVGRVDDDRVDVLAVVELVVVAAEDRGLPGELLEVRAGSVAAPAPDVRHRGDLEVNGGGVLLKSGNQAAARAVREADDADADAVVGTL